MHQLYRHFDKDGELLYVGQSISALSRLMSHNRSPWIREIAFVEIDVFSSAEGVSTAEAMAIATEMPIYNRVQPKEKRDAPERFPDRTPHATRNRDPERRDAGLSVQGADPPKPVSEVGTGKDLPRSARQEPVISSSQVKRGRPRIGEQRAEPWIAAGMSERTWYRRKKEQSK